MNETARSRDSMITGQLMTGRVLDAHILDAMHAVPRERFVPQLLQGSAYVDDDIALGHGRYLMEPLVLGRLLQEAELTAEDAVLDVAAATGYSTALLSRLAGKVTLLEDNRDFLDTARAQLGLLNVRNVEYVSGALIQGHAPGSPYSAIFIQGAVHYIPPALKHQLAEGGRLMTIENVSAAPGDAAGLGKAVIYRKIGGTLQRRILFDACVPVIPSFARKSTFEF